MPHVCGKKKIRFSFIPQQPQRGLSSFTPKTTNGYILAISQLTGLFPFIYRSISAATRYGFLIEALSLLRRKPQTAERHVSLSRGKFKACSCFWNTKSMYVVVATWLDLVLQKHGWIIQGDTQRNALRGGFFILKPCLLYHKAKNVVK